MAIISISDGNFVQATGFILIAALFDALDGAVARLTHSTSDLGTELDSLCDAVSFGVSPAFMLYKAALIDFSTIGVVTAAMPAMAGTFRLARFNVLASDGDDKSYFMGMPIPAGAIVIISYVLFFHLDESMLSADTKNWMIFAVPLLTALFMVSSIRFDSLPKPTPKTLRDRKWIFAYFVIGIVAIAWTEGLLLFPFMVGYCTIAVVRQTIGLLKGRINSSDEMIEEDDPDPLDL